MNRLKNTFKMTYTDTFNNDDEKAVPRDTRRVTYRKDHDTFWMKKTLEKLKGDDKKPEQKVKTQILDKAMTDHLIAKELAKGNPDETQKKVLGDVIKAACSGGTFHILLHGGPGSGKTYSTKQIVEILRLATGITANRSHQIVSQILDV